MTDAVESDGAMFDDTRSLNVSGPPAGDFFAYSFGRSHHATNRDQSGLPLMMLDGHPVVPLPSRARSTQLALKRIMDIVLAGGALIVLLPLLAGIALAIRLSGKGSVLFRQSRPGLNGQPFELLKFRTMRHDACDVEGLKQATSNDERVTRLGKFLRATSLDELPQLWNILIGEMSIIGPRPMVSGMLAVGRDYRELVPYYDFRLLMKPGLSGWAQANGFRGPTDAIGPAIARIDHDCAYIQNFSVALDIKTIAQTLFREFITGTGL